MMFQFSDAIAMRILPCAQQQPRYRWSVKRGTDGNDLVGLLGRPGRRRRDAPHIISHEILPETHRNGH